MVEIMPIWDYSKNTPLYVQLYEYIKHEIQIGTIKPETKLPSKRKLSTYLGISQNTIQTAYEQLCAEGYVESRPRIGMFVTKIEDNLSCNTPLSNKPDKSIKLNEEFKYLIDFSSGNVDLEHFPYCTWRKLTTQCLYSDQSNLLLIGESQGEECLRKEISKYLFQSRSVRCIPEQIIIGAGMQYLMILLCMLLGKDYTYAIENPGFNKARNVFIDQGLDVHPISIDEDGICVEDLRKSSAKVVYVTPSHQFPCGMVMPVSRRLELLKWCEEKNGYIIEDDYDSEFRYRGKPIPSLQGLDRNGKVIYMGTFSKSLIPSIRISYLVLPQNLIEKYQKYLKIYKQTVSRLHQNTLYKFMKEGYFSSHINKMRTLYRKKHSILLSSIDKHMKEKTEVIGANSGLHILLKVKNGMTEEELIQCAHDVKIKIYPTSIHYNQCLSSEFPMILLGFGGLTEKQIEDGIKILKKAWLI
ncbi:GntR family transcriptional regulator [Clostridium carboxidivorans P7]|uniref:Transcriptional regulator, GntR family n=1 Tax=Clostridium carboxidivorans P7 TaxID=536227 RepID=C6PTT2_9CLOT|nr:PLP-dependent aminotransferase family protein [Clostridium carboxidivorans]AKN31446.1 GntR family transcriptional regulator [Clostridium carboxidivorans P7]EET87322.1 transcriptional regulator, GntR family [Clostridium carboxidivorans P7]EFG87164.1 transcriptional regulator, GntR family [Clostridium carboxidivorans P7]